MTSDVSALRNTTGDPNPEWSDEADGWFRFQAGEGGLAIGPTARCAASQQPGRMVVNFETSGAKRSTSA